MLSEQQAKQLREKIIEQIGSWDASDEQKAQAVEQIESMPDDELENFLIQNKLIKTESEKETCPFCLIIEGKIPAFKIGENQKALAVLEINPLSKGHAIVFPRKHEEVEKLPDEAFGLAKKIAGKIKSELKPQAVNIQTDSLLGHTIINIIPVYERGKLEKKRAQEQELKELQEQLRVEEPEPRAEKKEEKSREPEKLEKAPKRIP